MSTTDTHEDADLIERLAAYRAALDDAIAADVGVRGPGADSRDRSAGRRRVPLVAAAVVVALAGVVGLVAVDARRSSAPGPAVVSSTPEDTLGDELDPTPVDPLVEPLIEPLVVGSTGEQVRVLQRRLDELGFAVGPVDGVFGDETLAAVWAFEKIVIGVPAAEATGVVDAAVWNAVHADVEIERRGSPPLLRHVEVWLPEQVVVVFDRQGPLLVTHASSGSGEKWCDTLTIDPGEHGNEDGEAPRREARCGVGVTPGGRFVVHRSVEGRVVRTSQGRLVDPLFFNYSLAIAGATEVPLEPVSRGTVSVPAWVIGEIRELVGIGTPVWVFDGEHDPAELGAQPPAFDWPDPGTEQVPMFGELGYMAIGDSVMLGAAERLADLGMTVDAEVSRQMVDLVPTVGWIGAAEPAAVIVHVGTNGPIQAATLDVVLDQLADVPYVIVLTVRADRSWTHRNNELLRASATDHPNVVVIDWDARADECVGDCFASDGVHLRPDGVAFYVQLIAEVLGLTR